MKETCWVCGEDIQEAEEMVYFRNDDGVPWTAHAKCADEDRVMTQEEVDEYYDAFGDAVVRAIDESMELEYEEGQNGVYAHSVPYEDANVGFDSEGAPIGG